MTQKHVVIIILIILFGGLAAAGANSIQKSSTLSPTPTPTPKLTLDSIKSPSPSQKMIKQYSKFPGELAPKDLKDKKAVLQTSKGVIEFEIYHEATKAASNFILLTTDTFYDGLTFHRVVPGFVIQGGDPLGNGTGGPGYQFEDEPVTMPYAKGVVAMANSGPNTNGSQFFIMLEDNLDLPPNYTIFGKVIKGQEVVDKVQVGDRILKATIQALAR
jgi:cyclophilin family peptidyl-prolyl cis-trans isomerase